MFIVKAEDAYGHSVYECASYRYNTNHQHPEITGPEISLFDASQNLIVALNILGNVYVMNANGKTVDAFPKHPRPAPDP